MINVLYVSAAVLIAVREGPSYADEIRKRISDMTGGAMSPANATVWRAIRELSIDGLVSIEQRRVEGTSAFRNYVTITSDGERQNQAAATLVQRVYSSCVDASELSDDPVFFDVELVAGDHRDDAVVRRGDEQERFSRSRHTRSKQNRVLERECPDPLVFSDVSEHAFTLSIYAHMERGFDRDQRGELGSVPRHLASEFHRGSEEPHLTCSACRPGLERKPVRALRQVLVVLEIAHFFPLVARVRDREIAPHDDHRVRPVTGHREFPRRIPICERLSQVPGVLLVGHLPRWHSAHQPRFECMGGCASPS